MKSRRGGRPARPGSRGSHRRPPPFSSAPPPPATPPSPRPPRRAARPPDRLPPPPPPQRGSARPVQARTPAHAFLGLRGKPTVERIDQRGVRTLRRESGELAPVVDVRRVLGQEASHEPFGVSICAHQFQRPDVDES